jgi:hypothetical protein
MPKASTCIGQSFFLKKTVAANTLTISPFSGDTFESATSLQLLGKDEFVEFKSIGGTAWVIVSLRKAPIVTRFTSNGTWTPTQGMKYAIAEVQGGGGGGGAITAPGSGSWSTGGGSGGSYAKALIPASAAGTSQAITVGAAGLVPGSTGTGGVGGQSSIGALVAAPGGLGGAQITNATVALSAGGGPPADSTISGTCVTLELAIGQSAASAISQAYQNGTNQLQAAAGGASKMGRPGIAACGQAGNWTSLLASTPETNAYGAGGSGTAGYGNTGLRQGTNGIQGIVIITEYF